MTVEYTKDSMSRNRIYFNDAHSKQRLKWKLGHDLNTEIYPYIFVCSSSPREDDYACMSFPRMDKLSSCGIV